ncbi:GNAT family N-acetyltransferase [Kitasatospora sp. NPDC050543]|uniref:GNAT family N-acetyltransferase n=1 Tax=Kitasatospora sp. NPDC050543 TaxID=3364054 RepID=UPI0037A6A18D
MRAAGQCPPQWAALDADPPLFASARWLAAMGDRIEGAHWWLVHRPGGDGPEVGFFGSVSEDSSISEAKNPWRLLFEPGTARSLTRQALERQAAARAAGPAPEQWFPSLVLTYPGLECFPLGPGRYSAAALDGAIAEVVAEARAAALRSVAFLYVQPEETELAAALRRAGFLEVPTALRANLRLPGGTFEDYLASLGRDARKGVARIRRRLATRGVTVRRQLLRDADDRLIEELVGLRLKHRAKYGRRPDAAGERSQLHTLRASFGEHGRLQLAVADGRTIGFCLFLEAGGIRHAWMTGTDYADPRSPGTYFELGFHAPIEEAYLTGCRELSFSYGAEATKLERGCRLDEVTSFVLPLDQAAFGPAREAAAALAGALVRPDAAGPDTH